MNRDGTGIDVELGDAPLIKLLGRSFRTWNAWSQKTNDIYIRPYAGWRVQKFTWPTYWLPCVRRIRLRKLQDVKRVELTVTNNVPAT